MPFVRRYLVTWVLALAVLVRAGMPLGFMPAGSYPSANGNLFVICSAQSFGKLLLNTADSSEQQAEHAAKSCAFELAAPVATLSTAPQVPMPRGAVIANHTRPSVSIDILPAAFVQPFTRGPPTFS